MGSDTCSKAMALEKERWEPRQARVSWCVVVIGPSVPSPLERNHRFERKPATWAARVARAGRTPSPPQPVEEPAVA